MNCNDRLVKESAMRATAMIVCVTAALLMGCADDNKTSVDAGGGGAEDAGKIGDAASGDTVEDATAKVDSTTESDTATTQDAGADGNFKWFSTCGDPVCKQGGWKAKDGTALCTTEKPGAGCDSKGKLCDPKNDCNSLLKCTDKDPKAGVGGCPISLRSTKTAIHYLDAQDEREYAAQLRGMKLATWRYRHGDGSTKLGFIIDDAPESVAIDGRGDRVDLYSYTSLAVAALKEQARQLQALRDEVARLRRYVAALPHAPRSL